MAAGGMSKVRFRIYGEPGTGKTTMVGNGKRRCTAKLYRDFMTARCRNYARYDDNTHCWTHSEEGKRQRREKQEQRWKRSFDVRQKRIADEELTAQQARAWRLMYKAVGSKTRIRMAKWFEEAGRRR